MLKNGNDRIDPDQWEGEKPEINNKAGKCGTRKRKSRAGPGFWFLFFRSNCFSGLDVATYQLDISHRGVVAGAETALQDAGVTTRALLVAGSQFVEQFANHFAVASTGKCQATVSNAVALGQCDQRFNHTTQLFSLGQSRLDNFMTNQGAGHVTEHGLTMAAVPVQLTTTLTMAHDLILPN
ncbi:hypothetical protein AN401_17695 [Zobellella denitrificans]|uniref:Uncharacterized protein n=1 Tax=Zobellella denitrificans TaxID=347534 RepID=A0A291HTR9_9GAMM|nr:hypothetical protein AN401_17695 [Zobellella denitrificans]